MTHHEHLDGTHRPVMVEQVMDTEQGVYLCIKDQHSVFLWVNENFAQLVGQTKEQLIGHQDSRTEHVAHDKEVMASGKPLLNFHETIDIPTPDGGTRKVDIVTQKGLLYAPKSNAIIGITVCFSLCDPLIIEGQGNERPVIVPDPLITTEADHWIQKLHMTEISLGGYFASGLSSDETILNAALPERFDGDRKFYSTNYYLLRAGEFLKLHALNQDELWFYQEGDAIRLHIFDSTNGVYQSVTVGQNIDQGELLQSVAPHNMWFGGEVIGASYVLVSCALAPAWDARDSFLPADEQLNALKVQFPGQAGLIDQLS